MKNKIINELCGLLFQDRCPGCATFCQEPVCPRCFDGLARMVHGGNCLSESSIIAYQGRGYLLRVRAGGTYRGLVKELVLGLKNSGRRFAVPLSELMLIAAGNDPSFISPDIVTFVPTTGNKRKERGYNPPEVLSNLLCKRLGLRRVDALQIIRRMRDQDGLSAQERWENANESFGLRAGFEKVVCESRVLIVDDVFTTGATLMNCAIPFVEHGAREVCAIVAAATRRE